MVGFGKNDGGKEERLEREIELYKSEIENLENYLISCVKLFEDAGIELEEENGRAHSPALANYIVGTIKYAKEAQALDDAHNSLIEGAEAAYKNCIDIMEDIADDTEKFLPDNPKGLKLATAYRKIGETFQSKVVALRGLK